MTDMDHWGVVERWNYPDDGYGDCEDYVLAKRKMLMQQGWPREALLITVVRDQHGDGHAILTVKTDKGEFILDNQTNDILLWSDTGYRFVKRQSQSDPNVWIALGDTARRRPPRPRARPNNRSYATPVTSPPLPVPRPGSRAAGSPPGAGRTFLGCKFLAFTGFSRHAATSRYRMKHEIDASIRGKSVDFVHPAACSASNPIISAS